MKELVFALQFSGAAEPVPGSTTRLRAKASASGQTLRSVIKPDGVLAAIEPSGGDKALFESEVDIVGEGQFVEAGTITYGNAGTVRFTTVGRGILGPAPQPGVQRGAVIWQIVEGEGRFRGAQGLITSNFTVGQSGEVQDNHFVRLFLPD